MKYLHLDMNYLENFPDNLRPKSLRRTKIKSLSDDLVPIYGNSYNKRNLDYYRKFYLLFPEKEIVNTCVHNLDWSHIRRVLSVANADARRWYLA